jgi:hypothetical protein
MLDLTSKLVNYEAIGLSGKAYGRLDQLIERLQVVAGSAVDPCPFRNLCCQHSILTFGSTI